jgi:TorA maturation chaperone TorD
MTAVTDRPEGSATYERARADIYALLAALLIEPPSAKILKSLRRLGVADGLPGQLHTALEGIGRAVRSYPAAEIELEFRQMFIGPGGGEILPFASWYRERRLAGGPLAELRGDLAGLGLCRREGACEPEDHAGVLCEILATVSHEDSGVPCERQRSFFIAHALPWLSRFFRDLREHRSAGFYREVGTLGEVFVHTEQRHLLTARLTGDRP